MNFDHLPFVDADLEPFASADRVFEQWLTLTLRPSAQAHPQADSHLVQDEPISGSLSVTRLPVCPDSHPCCSASVVPAVDAGLTITF